MHARSSSHGNGVWKSLDAGKTWTKIGLEKSFFIPKIAVDPKNPDVVYVAAEGKLYDNALDCERGLYKSTDGGKTWANVFPVKDRGIADFVIDPRDANVVIAAAYKTYRRAWTYIDRQPGNNLYKTTDGGQTWKMLEAGLPVKAELGRTGLAILEKNPAVLYARLDEEVNLGLAERDGVANFRAAGGFGGGGQGGLFADDWSFAKLKGYKIPAELAKQAPKFAPLTAENEAELVKKLNEFIADKDALAKAGVDTAKLNAAARKVHAKNKDLIAAIDEVEKLAAKEAPKADSTEAKGRAQIMNRHALEMLYGGVLRNQAPVKRSGVVYRTDDQGETWKRMTEYKTSGGSAQVNQTEGGYYGRIYVDQTNDQILYCCDTNITVSKDGGKTFAASGWDSGAYKLHVDHRGMWVDPVNGLHIMSANDGGAGETWDGGKHWSQKSTISAQQFYDVFVDNEQPYNVMGGTQDNGAWMGPNRNRNQWGVFANDWLYLPTGDGFYVVRDWWNPEWIYYESQFGSSSRMNLKNGETQSLAKRTTPEETAAGVPAQRYQWNAPIVLSPHNPGIVYICSQFVHRSLSHGDRNTFVTISPDLSKADKAKLDEAKKTNMQWATIYTFAESPKTPGLFWAGTDDGNVWMSPNGGVAWISITDKFYDKAGKPKPNVKGARIPYDKWVKRVVPSAFDENVCYVAFSGYRTHNEDATYLYVTRDKGKTFEDISGGLMNPLFDVEEDPDNAAVLYIAGDVGIHVTIDGGKTWTPFSNLAPNVPVRDMAIQKRDRDMAIGTYGRGYLHRGSRPGQGVQARSLRQGRPPLRPRGRGPLERLRAEGRAVRRVRQGRQPARRSHLLLFPQGRRQERQADHQGPRGHPDAGDRLRLGQERPAEGLLGPQPPGRGRRPGRRAGRRRPARRRRPAGRSRRLQSHPDRGRQGDRDQEGHHPARPDVQVIPHAPAEDEPPPGRILRDTLLHRRLTMKHATRVLGIALLALMLAAAAGAQDFVKYRTHAETTAWLQGLAKANPQLVKLESIGKTRQGRDLWALQIAAPGGLPAGERPALLIAANFDGDHLIGSELALFAADYLVKNAAKPEVKAAAGHLHLLHPAADESRRGRIHVGPGQVRAPAPTRRPMTTTTTGSSMRTAPTT